MSGPPGTHEDALIDGRHGLRTQWFNFDTVPRDNIHDFRGESIVGWNAERMQAAAHTAHQSGARTGFNDRGHEAGKFRQRPAPRRCQFRVNEVDTIKMVPIILHAAVKMRAT